MERQEFFGTSKNGESVMRFNISNQNGLIIKILDYGAIIQAIEVPDRENGMVDLVLGFDTLNEYEEQQDYYIGCIIGRVANRIERGTFTLDGTQYHVGINNGLNSLHGGHRGFDKVLWNAQLTSKNSLTLSYLSRDGDEGYPGNVLINVTYTVTENNCLNIDYKAITDQATPINLTNHTYFNLGGFTSHSSILDTSITIYADSIIAVDSNQIPIEIQDVTDTFFDLRQENLLGNVISSSSQGFDHYYIISQRENELVLASKVHHSPSKRSLECYTNQWGLQFYTGNILPSNDTCIGKKGQIYRKHSGFCLETQECPNAINRPFHGSSVLRPGNIYDHRVSYKFNF